MIAETAPGSSVALVYDAAGRPASLLAQQGLRPTTAGGHYADRRVAAGPALDPYRAAERGRTAGR